MSLLRFVIILIWSAKAERVSRIKQGDVKNVVERVKEPDPNAPRYVGLGTQDEEFVPSRVPGMEEYTQKVYEEIGAELVDKMFRTPHHTSAPCCCCYASTVTGACNKVSGYYAWMATKFCYSFTKTDEEGDEVVIFKGQGRSSNGQLVSWPMGRNIKCKGQTDNRGLCFHHEEGAAAKKRVQWLMGISKEKRLEQDKNDAEWEALQKKELEEKWGKGVIVHKSPYVHGIQAKETEGIITKGCPTGPDTCDIAFYEYEPTKWESYTRDQLEEMDSWFYGGGKTGMRPQGRFEDFDWSDDKFIKDLLRKGRP